MKSRRLLAETVTLYSEAGFTFSTLRVQCPFDRCEVVLKLKTICWAELVNISAPRLRGDPSVPSILFEKKTIGLD